MSEIKAYGLDSSLIHDAGPKDGFVVDVVRFSDYAELEKKYQALAGENVVLTEEAARELSNAWLLHRAIMTTQALNEIKAQGVDEFVTDIGLLAHTLRPGSPQCRTLKTIIFRAATFAASLRGSHEIKS